MARLHLKTNQKRQLRKLKLASGLAVELAMIKLAKGKKNGNGFLNRNRYARDASKLVAKEKVKRLHGEQFASYVAASVPLHQIDGWGFLSRASEALSKGDWLGAVHLAYYAELRGAMALLAAQGVAVLNNYHVVLDKSGSAEAVTNLGTHQFVWAALEEWRRFPAAFSSILEAMLVESRPISEWLSFAGTQQTVQVALLNQWTRNWSLDIQRMAEDRDLRNFASYRPSRMQTTGPRNVGNCLEPLVALWDSCRPGLNGAFANLDLHLLRLALDSVYRSTTDQDPSGPAFEAFIDGILRLHGETHLRGFLLRSEESQDHAVIRLASDRSSPESVLPVLARAVLLLRISGAAGHHLIASSGFDKDKLQFWWQSVGEDCGLWSGTSVPDDFADMWEDVKDAVAQFNALLLMPGDSLANAWNRAGPNLTSLCQFQRAGLWALGL
jgi:hypothetical protein